MTVYTEKCSRNFAAATAGASLIGMFRRWMRNQLLKSRISAERRQLAEMSDGMLRDIGVNRAEAEIESRRSDIPAERSANYDC